MKVQMALLVIGTCLAPCSTADEVDSKSVQEVRDWAQDVVQRLVITNKRTGEALTSHAGSLIRWSNPIIGNVYGDSYLWLDDGRPAVFLSLYAVYDAPEGNRRLTFQSLSTDPLDAELDGQKIWAPRESGVEFREVDEFRSPSKNIRQQVFQQRQIARQFEGRIAEKSDPERLRKLRNLATPLMSYQSEAADVKSGSLFAMVDGTDPELLLMIEARLVDGEQKWFYAPVRQNHRRLQLSRKGHLEWEGPALAPPFPNPKISDPAGVYFNSRWDRLAKDVDE